MNYWKRCLEKQERPRIEKIILIRRGASCHVSAAEQLKGDVMGYAGMNVRAVDEKRHQAVINLLSAVSQVKH